MFFLPNKKINKSHMMSAIKWAVIAVLYVIVSGILNGTILWDWSQQYPGLSGAIKFGIITIITCMIVFNGLKGKAYAKSKEIAFLYENNELYIFTAFVSPGIDDETINNVVKEIGRPIDSDVIFSSEDNIKMLKDVGYYEKIIKVNNLVKQNDGCRFNCMLENRHGKTRDTIVSIKEVYTNYNQLVEILDKIK